MTAPSSPDFLFFRPVEKLTTLLDIRLIFLSEVTVSGKTTSLLTVVLPEKAASQALELAAVLTRQLQEESSCLYRVFPLDYVRQQLLAANLFFLNACPESACIHRGQEDVVCRGWRPHPEDLARAESAIRCELERASAFASGADFFANRGIYPQATFMLHQSVELLYRTAELFIMGKERKTHCIREHQNHIRHFSPEMGRIWDPDQPEVLELLALLDAAYIQARYQQGFTLEAKQFEALRLKGEQVQALVSRLFQHAVIQCRAHMAVEEGNEDHNGKQDPAMPQSEESTLARIRDLASEHFRTLDPYLPEKGLYSIPLPTPGYQAAGFLASHLIKVCMLALETNPGSRTHIPEPNRNIREVLGIIPHLIPLDEMEFLDTLRECLHKKHRKD